MIITASVIDDIRTAFRREFDEAYRTMRAMSFYSSVAYTASSGGASNTYGWLGAFPQMREWVGDRVVKNLKEAGYVIPNRLWEDTVGLNRTDIEDDNLGMYTGLIQALAQECATHPDVLIAQLMREGEARLCFDGQNFFDTDHPVYAAHDGTGAVATVSNYDDGGGAPGPAWYLLDCSRVLRPFIFQERMAAELEEKSDPRTSDVVFMKDQYLYGARARHAVGYGFWQMAYKSRAPLTEASFKAARLGMRSTARDGGTPMGIKPTHLVVGPSLQAAAEDLILRDLIGSGNKNPLYKSVEVLDIDWIE